ncbi:MAG: 1-acyl-sn-glycerol-3-phosphate acyltransferase [Pirellulaceae bacterium]
MQNIIIEKPYRFIPPHQGNWWPTIIQLLRLYLPHLRRKEGVEAYEVRHAERLRQSLDAGHGILLTPNHCRTADPLVMGFLARDVGTHVFAMASWHLFNQDRFTAWAIRKMGAFSVNREGVDRAAIDTAVSILEEAKRPLILFPEGATSRTNDRLQALLDGVAFIARTAAKKRAKRDGGQVVIHPIAIKYFFQGDLEAAVTPVLADMEQRFSWLPQSDLPIVARIAKVGRALLCLKEIEYFGQEQAGSLSGRIQGLINRLLHPIEHEWLGAPQEGPVVPRVKNVRMKILPAMVQGSLDANERNRRWRQLADLYLSQQVSCYPPDYLTLPTVDRLLETVERFEEDLTDKARVHGHLKAVMEVGEPIVVSTQRDRQAATDPLMARLAQELQAMLDRLARESPLVA